MRALLMLVAVTALQRAPGRAGPRHAAQRPQTHQRPQRCRTLRRAVPDEEVVIDEDAEEAAPTLVEVAPRMTTEELIEAVGEPPSAFDWDAHLARLEAEAQADKAEALEEERIALGDGWTPAGDDFVPPEVYDSEPECLKVRWDEVDPAESNFRNPPASRGATWSRIRIKSEWWQFEDGERLKTEEGWTRFDQRAYNVTNNLFEPARDFTYGPIDLPVAAKIAPALDILGSGCQLLEASDGVVRIKYVGQAKNRVGMEAYATGLVRDRYPELETLTFEARHVSDYLDGADDTANDGWR